MRKEKRVARIFQEPTGKYHICGNDLGYLDVRGKAYNTRREAIANLRADLMDYPPEANCYTHYINSSGKIIKL